jgi:hypothetical protein
MLSPDESPRHDGPDLHQHHQAGGHDIPGRHGAVLSFVRKSLKER